MDGKEGLSKEDVLLLRHLADSMDEAMSGLRESYEKKDFEGFNKIKRLMMGLQKKISEVLG